MNVTWQRGRNDCYQDHCENAPFGSVGGLEKRGELQCPKWIKPEEAKDYLEGYIECAKELYGDDWQTCKFSWKPALTIEGKKKPKCTSVIVGRAYKHKKSGAIYRVVETGIDCTNVRDGTVVVIYYNPEDDSPWFVRELSEFRERFEIVPLNLGEAVTPDLDREVLGEALHPNGRCTCAGEGKCEWCKGLCPTCGGSGDCPPGQEIAGVRNVCPTCSGSGHIRTLP